MNKILLMIFLTPVFCYSQNSTITGNIIYKFDGDSYADVTSQITLLDLSKKYSLKIMDKDSIKSTTSDILGNYTFKNVSPGHYIIYIKSKGSLVDPFYFYTDISGGTLSDEIKSMTGFDFSTLRLDLQSQIEAKFEETIKLSEAKKFGKYKRADEELSKLIAEYMQSAPDEIKLFFNLSDGGKFGREFKQATIKAGNDENYTTIFTVDSKYE